MCLPASGLDDIGPDPSKPTPPPALIIYRTVEAAIGHAQVPQPLASIFTASISIASQIIPRCRCVLHRLRSQPAATATQQQRRPAAASALGPSGQRQDKPANLHCFPGSPHSFCIGPAVALAVLNTVCPRAGSNQQRDDGEGHLGSGWSQPVPSISLHFLGYGESPLRPGPARSWCPVLLAVAPIKSIDDFQLFDISPQILEIFFRL